MKGNVLEVAEFLYASVLLEEGDDDFIPSQNIDAMADIFQNIAAVGSGDPKVLQEILLRAFQYYILLGVMSVWKLQVGNVWHSELQTANNAVLFS